MSQQDAQLLLCLCLRYVCQQYTFQEAGYLARTSNACNGFHFFVTACYKEGVGQLYLKSWT